MFKRILLALGLAFAIAHAQAHSVRDLQLDEIIDGAAVAFQGTVIEQHAARDPQTNRIVTYTTFAVQDVLKGTVGTTYTIKQLGGELPAEGIAYKVDLRTTFNVGDTSIVFLHGKSSIGFSSPVGSSQGNFVVMEDAAGPVVTNGRAFAKMTERMAADQAKARSLPQARADGKKVGLDDFKQLVRSRVGVSQ
jgi:hypothetical protein